MWTEEIVKLDTCSTKEEKKAFKHVAQNKYHVQRGTRLHLYADGWTPVGREHFDTICHEVRDMMKSTELWSTLHAHWKTYVTMNHRYSYVRNDRDAIDYDHVVTSDNDDDDDDCIVCLAGDDKDCYDDDNSAAAWSDLDEQGREKRMRVESV